MTSTDALLRVENLRSWYGESQVLFGLSFEVKAGETVTLLGRNGAGKTTSLRSIVGLVKRREGSITLAGHDLLTTPIHQVSRLGPGLGYVPEERGIFSTLSVEENLRLPPTVSGDGLSIEEIYRMFPNLEERKASPGTKLSGGEQQMLAIARVLRTGARVLLLDEPTEGLAPVIVQRIASVLQNLKALGYTILLVEQNFRFASKIADRFYVIENGQVIDAMAASELKSRTSTINSYLGV